MSYLVTLFGRPVAVFGELESAECALMALPFQADEDASIIVLPYGGDQLLDAWHGLSMEKRGTPSEARGARVTLFSDKDKIR